MGFFSSALGGVGSAVGTVIDGTIEMANPFSESECPKSCKCEDCENIRKAEKEALRAEVKEELKKEAAGKNSTK